MDPLAEKILIWYKENGRDLPWRQTTDPYRVMVAEFMLQQTQVSRVIPKYESWLAKFPDAKSLASASNREVLEAWQGLGYNRRAIWLKDAASAVVEEFPREVKELEALKGVGKYTARSILIFAFNEDLATVDTNIKKVLITEKKTDGALSEKEWFILASKFVPPGKSRDYHNGMMDYASIMLKGVRIPQRKIAGDFRGSSRYYRGRILSFLLDSPNATIDELAQIGGPNHQKILDSLLADGLVKFDGKQYLL